MPIITDAEFGQIVVAKRPTAKQVSARVGPDGRLRITMPTVMPLIAARAMLSSQRSALQELLKDHQTTHAYTTDQPIGKRHYLRIEPTDGEPAVTTAGTQIIVYTPDQTALLWPTTQQQIRTAIITALRHEAKQYLGGRLRQLAQQHDLSYQKLRLTHAASRWGSYSAGGTISLNIALMKLPNKLIDYVLIHELCHTKHLNHSQAFWREVSQRDPNYQQHRRQLSRQTPAL